MKKLLHYADCLMLLAGIIGCALRLQFGNTGMDGFGLYRRDHPAWIGLCVLTLGVLILNYFLTRDPGDNSSYSDNFPRSIVGGITCILLAIAMGYNGIMDLLVATALLDQLLALASMLSAVCLAVAGVERFSGNQPVFFAHMVPCIYFALRLFAMGRDLGTEPEICGFLYQFLASVSMIPALYWLGAFDVNMGSRRKSLFFSLCALYFCLIATFEAKEGVGMYLLYSAMLLTNMCRTRYLPATEVAEEQPVVETEEKPAAETEEQPAAETEEQPVAETEEQPAAETEEQPAAEEDEQPAHVPLIFRGPMVETEPVTDLDVFLEDTKQFLDSLQYEV